MSTCIHFSLRTCDVSALAGRSTYRSQQESLADFLDTLQPPRPASAEPLRHLIKTMEKEVREGMCYAAAVQKRALNPNLCGDAERESLQVFDRYSARIPRSARTRLRHSLRSIYLKDRGIWMEIDTLKRLHTVNVHWRPSERRQRCFSKLFTSRTHAFTYTINGTVDGLEWDPVAQQVCGVLEVKSRKTRVNFPRQDLDQLMMYLVLSDLPQGRLVQDVSGLVDASFIMTLEEARARWEDQVRPFLEMALQYAMSFLSQNRGASYRRMRFFTHRASAAPPIPRSFRRGGSSLLQGTIPAPTSAPRSLSSNPLDTGPRPERNFPALTKESSPTLSDGPSTQTEVLLGWMHRDYPRVDTCATATLIPLTG